MKITYDGVTCEAETDDEISEMIFAVMDLASARMKWSHLAVDLEKEHEELPR